ncbi:hypothetical protein, partial [Chloroflexus aurantiacus]|uniref:hypothetical protein n=2 Tax=Chloroflexus TaxID=1107 RepID=UPI0023578247
MPLASRRWIGVGVGATHASPLLALVPGSHALPITGVNHVRISEYERHGCCCGQLARWQRAAPAVLSRTGKVALRAHHVRVAG